jgi:hypothetical protein
MIIFIIAYGHRTKENFSPSDALTFFYLKEAKSYMYLQYDQLNGLYFADYNTSEDNIINGFVFGANDLLQDQVKLQEYFNKEYMIVESDGSVHLGNKFKCESNKTYYDLMYSPKYNIIFFTTETGKEYYLVNQNGKAMWSDNYSNATIISRPML